MSECNRNGDDFGGWRDGRKEGRKERRKEGGRRELVMILGVEKWKEGIREER